MGKYSNAERQTVREFQLVANWSNQDVPIGKRFLK